MKIKFYFSKIVIKISECTCNENLRHDLSKIVTPEDCFDIFSHFISKWDVMEERYLKEMNLSERRKSQNR